MKVCVYATPAALFGAGIERFARMLLKHLPSIAPDIDFVYYYYYLPLRHFFLYENRPKILKLYETNVKQILLPMPRKLTEPVFEFFNINHSIFYGNVDIFYTPDYIYPKKKDEILVNTIHDVCLLKYSEFMSDEIFKTQSFYINKGIKEAKHIITISETSKKDIMEYLNIPSEKISVIYVGFDIPNDKEDNICKDVRKDLLQKINCEYILSVGSINPRKNYIGLLKAYRILIDRGYKLDLIIAGNKGWKNEEFFESIKELKLLNKVSVFTQVSNTELRILYSNASIFVFPSFYEGFGIPPLEASSYSLPVVCSDTSSMPEVMGDSALYVNPYEPEDIAEKMIMVIDDSELRSRLIKNGKENIKRFSWERAASDLADVFRKVYGQFHQRKQKYNSIYL